VDFSLFQNSYFYSVNFISKLYQNNQSKSRVLTGLLNINGVQILTLKVCKILTIMYYSNPINKSKKWKLKDQQQILEKNNHGQAFHHIIRSLLGK